MCAIRFNKSTKLEIHENLKSGFIYFYFENQTTKNTTVYQAPNVYNCTLCKTTRNLIRCKSIRMLLETFQGTIGNFSRNNWM